MILLDTHVWVNYIGENLHRLSQSALQTIDETNNFGISAISCWEVSLLAEKSKLKLGYEARYWIKDALAHPKSVLFDLDVDLLITSTQLENFHRDPADRIIATTSYLTGIPLITKDKKIRNWGQIKTIW